jgi:hypothetical protein
MRLLPILFALFVAALVPTPAEVTYAYAGICNPADGWEVQNFDGLPICLEGQPLASTTIVARKGMKLRANLPAGTTFGAEVGRLRKGQKMRLVSLLGMSTQPGAKVFWAGVEPL